MRIEEGREEGREKAKSQGRCPCTPSGGQWPPEPPAFAPMSRADAAHPHATSARDGREEAQAPLVSVVIVNWNTRDLLRACLSSLPWRRETLRLEVIVVDNGSEDGSAEMVDGEFPQARLIRNEENVGFVRANNQGLRAARGDFLFMLNSDTEVREGCIERLVEVAGGEAQVGAVGPRLLNTDGTPQVSYGPFPRLLHRLLPARFEPRYVEEKMREAEQAEAGVAAVDWLSGAALLCRREVVDTVGPLDERYFMWYDDLDWCRKLRGEGLRRLFVVGAEVVHHGRQSGGKLDDPVLQAQLWDSEYTYLRLHEGLAATWVVYGLRVGKALARWMLPAGRREAKFRLQYHRERFVRFCLRGMPGRQDQLPTVSMSGGER